MTLIEHLRAGENDPMWADHCEMPKRVAKAAADRIEMLEAAAKQAHQVFAAEIEGLHKIIEMNKPDYKRTVVVSIDGL